MEEREILEKSIELDNKTEKIKKEIEKINIEYRGLKDSCKHKIVFRLKDNHPRKVNIDGTYFCPACGQNIEFFFKNEYKYSCFKDSKVVLLDNLSLICDRNTLLKIKNEVLNNYDFYYNCKEINELRVRMEDVLKDSQNVYKKEHILSKRNK